MGSALRRFGSAVALTLGVIALPTVAAAAPGPGTFTSISTPAHSFVYHWVDGAANHLHISGTTSNDVTSVDLICIYLQPTGNPFVTTLASAVPVTAGSFGKTVTIHQLLANCRLRALPTGEPTTGYLGAYAGPIMYMYGAQTTKDAGTPYSWLGVGENTALIGIVADAGECGPEIIAALPSPSLRLESALAACFEALPAGNVTASGNPTASSVKIDGHNAYLPFAVHGWRQTPQSLTVTQTAVSVSVTRNSAGVVTFVDREPFARCSVSDTYPPTTASCPAMVATGVKLVRTMTWIRGGHQFKVRDAFVELWRRSQRGGAVRRIRPAAHPRQRRVQLPRPARRVRSGIAQHVGERLWSRRPYVARPVRPACHPGRSRRRHDRLHVVAAAGVQIRE